MSRRAVVLFTLAASVCGARTELTTPIEQRGAADGGQTDPVDAAAPKDASVDVAVPVDASPDAEVPLPPSRALV